MYRCGGIVMNNKRKMIITAIVTIILAVSSAIFGVNYSERDVKEISDSVETVVNYVDNATSTTEIVETTETEEQTLEVEQEVESDAVVEQENIAYNGSSTGNGLSMLGECTGLTYYSQADTRWANYLYTSTNNNTQTMKSSACRSNFGCYCCKFVQRFNSANNDGRFIYSKWI